MEFAEIALDQFPVIAYTPDGARYEPARIVVVNGRVQVWFVPNGFAEPEVAFEREVLSIEGNRLAGHAILTADGEVRANSAGGCGCGSRLRSFDPYAGATRVVSRS